MGIAPFSASNTYFNNPIITQGFVQAMADTLYMTGVATLFTIIVGLPLGLILQATSPGALLPQPHVNRVLGFVVNIGRSLPFLILMVAIIPFTRFVAGTSLGPTAAIVPLTVGAIPFFARLVETSVREVASGKVEAALMMGSTKLQVMRQVLLAEALPGIVAGLTTTVITLLSYTAMAGTVGGGGIGDMAISYGYNRFMADVMIVAVVSLVILVQLIQMSGDFVARRIDHR